MSHPLTAVVTVWYSEGGGKEAEYRVGSLEELYEVCKKAPPSKLVRVSIDGSEGSVTLNFANFLHK
jgi:hypothetical protein